MVSLWFYPVLDMSRFASRTVCIKSGLVRHLILCPPVVVTVAVVLPPRIAEFTKIQATPRLSWSGCTPTGGHSTCISHFTCEVTFTWSLVGGGAWGYRRLQWGCRVESIVVRSWESSGQPGKVAGFLCCEQVVGVGQPSLHIFSWPPS